MNLMSIVNINEDRKDHKIINGVKKSVTDRDYGYSIYESLEYVKSNLGQNSDKLQMEMMKSFIR
jgi:hypothetical protein